MRLLMVLALLSACDTGDERRRHPADDTGDTGQVGVLDDGPTGFIGSPCEIDVDCDFAGGTCLTDGYPRGMCTAACDRYCDDATGHPVTFCVSDEDLPASAAALGDGACHSRCDFGIFPETGCRPDYACAVTERGNEPGTLNYACLPNVETDLSACYFGLADRGVAFEPTIIADAHPSTHPGLTCHVQDALYLFSPVHDIDLRYFDGDVTSRVLAACGMAHSLVDTVDDVADEGAVSVRHIGTYNCRVIAGTNSLSRHAYGDAIDIYGFDMAGGDLYTLVDDWQHDTSNPQGDAAIFLYDAAYRWHDLNYWNIILTPNYNAAHDNHFHVDLTPSADYIGFTGGYVGPAYVDDCGGPPMLETWRPIP